MNRPHWTGVALIVIALAGCKNNGSTSDGISPGEGDKWRDPNFEILPIGAFNYTDYAIYSVYLMPTEKSDIDFAAHGGVGEPQPQDARKWEMASSGAALAWDRRWTSPHKFKVWWLRVVNKKLFDTPNTDYDIYTNRGTEPGAAWCEGEVEIKEQFGEPYGPPFPNMTRRELVLYFFPDGTVKGSLEFSSFEGIELVDISKRNDLPVMRDRACLKQVANPLFGKRKPKLMN